MMAKHDPQCFFIKPARNIKAASSVNIPPSLSNLGGGEVCNYGYMIAENHVQI